MPEHLAVDPYLVQGIGSDREFDAPSLSHLRQLVVGQRTLVPRLAVIVVRCFSMTTSFWASVAAAYPTLAKRIRKKELLSECVCSFVFFLFWLY